jgi:asparagine synthase (glutamine-hydrolysing)
MCGICGVLQLDGGPAVDEALLRRMVGALDHRGPDENGGYRDQQVALGHARLSIIDLSGGGQPIANETRDIWVVFNGEIFNYVELQRELEAAGHVFSTKSDTETIVHAYEQWGDACVERFNGQFAFAIWDRPKKRLFMARDRVGIRPLYFAKVGRRLLFGSEIKSVVQDPDLERRIDPVGLAQVFSFWAPVAPRTIMAGVDQLQPGHFMVVENGNITIKQYWQPQFTEPDPEHIYCDRKRIAELSIELRDHLEEATKLRMLRADVPVGVYVSGGIDSSVIGSLVRRFHEGHLRTFSLRFAHRDFDEGGYQQKMVERLGTEHFSVEVDYKDIAQAFYDVVWYAEAPMLRSAPAPLYLLSKLVRQNGYKVVLTGEGSDEFLAGYDIFREDKVRRHWAKDPNSKHRPRLLERLYPWLVRSPTQVKALQRTFFGKGMDRIDRPFFSHIPRWDSAASLQRMFQKDIRAALEGQDIVSSLEAMFPEAINRWEPLGKAQYVEIVTLLSGYLLSTQGDRMLMGNSVEGRFPFLDHNVMEFANALPPEAKLRVLDEKHLLKRAAADLLPPEILKRPKQPYRAPDAQSFVQDDAPDYVAEVTSEKAVAEAGLFEPKGVQKL